MLLRIERRRPSRPGVAPDPRSDGRARRRRLPPAECCLAEPTLCSPSSSPTSKPTTQRGRGAPRPRTPGAALSFAGTDIGTWRNRGLFAGDPRLTSRETGRPGRHRPCRSTCDVVRRPRMAILSTGDEIVPARRASCEAGRVYDSNGRILADAVQRARRPSRSSWAPSATTKPRYERRSPPGARRTPTWCCSRAELPRARAISTAGGRPS